MTRADHQAWAREVLADPKTAVLDTETTGLRGYVCEVSVYDARYMKLNGGHRAGEDCKAVFDRLREMADGQV